MVVEGLDDGPALAGALDDGSALAGAIDGGTLGGDDVGAKVERAVALGTVLCEVVHDASNVMVMTETASPTTARGVIGPTVPTLRPSQ